MTTTETTTSRVRNRLRRALSHERRLVRGGRWAWALAGLCRDLRGRARTLFLLAAALAAALVSVAASPQGFYMEPFRPQYHFTPEKNWMNDPNGMVFYEGEYHLFYQYNPAGDKWGHMSWGHAVSPDMVHWTHLPLALAEADNVMIFSGSAVVDWKNSSGFGKDGRPPLVAVYTGFRTTDRVQFQCIAYSNDKGRTWTKYSGNPVIDINSMDFRDPKVQWHDATRRWIMTVSLSAEHKVRFYGSDNLKAWTLLSEFGPAGATGGVWECPDLFELPLPGTNDKRWVLVVNMNPGSVAGGSGGQYFIGRFDGTQFVADRDSLIPPRPGRSASESAHWFDYGPDYYAAVSWSDVPASDGRRLWLGWMSNWEYGGDVPTSPWRSAMSIPREVGLSRTAEGIRLVQKPAREMESLRDRHFAFKSGDVSEANAWLKERHVQGDQLELMVEFAPRSSGTEGVKVLKSDTEATVIGVDRQRGRAFVDRTQSGNVTFHQKFSGVYDAPLAVHDGRVKLHLFVDASSVEVFVNDGERVFTSLVYPSAASRGVEFFGSMTSARITSLNVWTLKSIWK
ncbi:MAG: glycoside hydrolase family 32 protein [Pseudolabrys sp.]